jgi:hypothetical protein
LRLSGLVVSVAIALSFMIAIFIVGSIILPGLRIIEGYSQV